MTDIMPFFGERLTRTNLRIPIILLPYRFFIASRPLTRDVGTPELLPYFKGRFSIRRAAEKMNVVRHDDIAIHLPVIGGSPNRPQQIVNFRTRQKMTA